MDYKPRFSRRETHGYDASFGRAGKAITAVFEQNPRGWWHVAEGFAAGAIEAHKKISVIKSAWGALAAAEYGGSSSTSIASVAAAPPTAAPSKGPPRIGGKPAPTVDVITRHHSGINIKDEKRYDGPCCPECNRPITGWFHDLPPCRCHIANTEEYGPDFLDGKMWVRGVGTERYLSPMGALDEVFHWMLRNLSYVSTDGRLDPLWEDVRAAAFRHTKYAEYRPERFAIKEQTNEQPPEADPTPDTSGDDAPANGDGAGDNEAGPTE